MSPLQGYTAPKAEFLSDSVLHPDANILLASDEQGPADEWTENEK